MSSQTHRPTNNRSHKRLSRPRPSTRTRRGGGRKQKQKQVSLPIQSNCRGCKIFFGGVPQFSSRKELVEHFTESFGPITKLQLDKRHLKNCNSCSTLQHRGSGYVVFEKEIHAKTALKQRNHFFEGRLIYLRMALPKKQK